MKRKAFIQKTALAGALWPVWGKAKAAPPAANVAFDETRFWNNIRAEYDLHPNLINLNNGGVSPQPLPVQEAHIAKYRFSNRAPSYNMWRELDKEREPLRKRLADFLGVLPEEIAFNRNATEGLNSVVFGLNLQPGDEVVLSKYDYPNIMNAWKQREKREGIKLNWVDLNLPEEDEDAIVSRYEKAITPRTKVVHLTHVLNWTGQIMPARKIADMAHAKGCEVLLDGAHSFAHLTYNLQQLNCDYYATSLHKWLCAPFGTGLLYIKKEKIKNVWALVSAPIPDADNIGKFECLGTRSFAAEMAVAEALTFHQKIGGALKQARLHTLKNYWAEKAARLPHVVMYTSLKPEYACGIATFGIKGVSPTLLAAKLHDEYAIHTSVVEHENVHGVRISPHVYTTFAELDKLVSAIEELHHTLGGK